MYFRRTIPFGVSFQAKDSNSSTVSQQVRITDDNREKCTTMNVLSLTIKSERQKNKLTKYTFKKRDRDIYPNKKGHAEFKMNSIAGKIPRPEGRFKK